MNKEFFKDLYPFLSFTWGIIMTFLGGIVFVVLLLFNIPTKVDYHKDMIYLTVGRNWGGMSLGPIAIVNENPSEFLLNHEYGHSIQNCLYGPFMIVISIMSFIRYWYYMLLEKLNKPAADYYDIWFEKEANKFGGN